MHQEEENLRKLQRERTARVKRILRWMPRRATVHRYPGLKWFAASARKRPYLWTFRVSAAVPAIYAGSILSLLPLYGVQIPLAVVCAFVFRANLPILVGLQWISNPVTAIPLYYAGYRIGRIILGLLMVDVPLLSTSELRLHMSGLDEGFWASNLIYALQVWGIMALGGLVMGIFVATLLSFLYRLGSRNATLTFQRIHALQEKRRKAHAEAEAAAEAAKEENSPSPKNPKPDSALPLSPPPASSPKTTS